MLTEEEQETLRAQSFVPRVIWAALLVSVFMYIGVSYMTQKPEVLPIDDTLRLVLAAIAFVTGVGSLLVYGFRLSPDALRKIMAGDDRVGALLGLFFPTLVLRLALAESVAIFGLVLAQMSGDPSEVLPFAAAAIVLMALAYPSPDGLRNRLLRL